MSEYDYCDFRENLVSERELSVDDSGPYLKRVLVRTVEQLRYNPHYKHADTICLCGHSYDRHFDSYENNSPIGCKYCDCRTFEPDLQQPLFPELPDLR